MSFEGFSDFEIQKITTGRNRKHDSSRLRSIICDVPKELLFVLVKLAKKIPCHTKLKQVVTEKEEAENIATDEISMTQEPLPKNKFVCVPLNEDSDDLIVKIASPEVDVCEDNNSKQDSKLQDFELQRKLMEEQNKMKRSLLQDAISKHAEKTQAEAKKLNEIRQALDVLDSELSNDVAILRKEIEVAALHFNNVEKRYSAIEKSFLQAKQDLYQAHEKKEMLTEHLYTIIAHNEDRKARKLGELMEKVGLTINENGSS